MTHASRLRSAALLLAATLLTACAATPPVTPAPEGAVPQPTPPVPVQPSPLCAWSQVRGVATVLSVASAMTNPALATWQFFPGDDIVFHPLPGGASQGDEYKALLRRALTGPCQSELYLVGPLQGTGN